MKKENKEKSFKQEDLRCPRCKTSSLRTQNSYSGHLGARKKTIKTYCLICDYTNSHTFEMSQEDWMKEVIDD